MSETTPLLSPPASQITQTDDVFNRFSRKQKRVIVAVIAFAGVISPFAAGSFFPCVPMVAKDLNTTGTIINLTVGVYMFVVSIGNLLWAPYSRHYGRQPIYLASLPLLCIGSLGVSVSQTVPQLVIGRTVQALGGSSILSVGAATISDIYKLEERGTAMGIFFGAVLLGPALAPVAGGLAATYSSWRTLQVVLFGMALTALICVITFLPETSHPGSRGIDKLSDQDNNDGVNPRKISSKWKWVWLNPVKSLAVLRGPNIAFVVVSGGLILMNNFVLLVPLSYTLAPRYGLTSPAMVGACFIFSGVGNIVGAPLAGYLSDQAIINGKKRRGGQWVPEDRLTGSLPGALILVPGSMLVFGMTTQFVSGKLGLAICLVCLFMNGIGVDIVLASSGTYIVDILRSRSAEVMAVNSAVRMGISSLASAAVLPAINSIGIGTTYTISAVFAWIAFGLLWVTIRYGAALRAWKDIGYTTSVGDC